MAEQKQGSTRTLPKNIRQIGTSSGTSRVYLEDYVYTYLHAQEELDAWTYRGFVLLGKIERGKDFARYFISGLIRVEDEFFKDCMLEFGDETWAYIYKEMKQYYEDLEIVGWGQDVSNASAGLAAEIERNHKQNFNIHKNVLFLLNLAEQEEAFYVFEKNMLQRKEGYYVYYEKNPQMQDYSEEYQAYYHEKMLETFSTRPYLWSTHVWNMFDFAADARDQGGEPGMNHKGLVTFDRKTKKDSFYLYKAYWSSEPFVHICSKRFQDRTEDTITVKVYTNQDSVTLLCDGKEISSKKGGHILSFQVPVSGKHVIEAVSGDLRDKAVFQKTDRPNPSYKLSVKSSNSANWV